MVAYRRLRVDDEASTASSRHVTVLASSACSTRESFRLSGISDTRKINEPFDYRFVVVASFLAAYGIDGEHMLSVSEG